MVALNCKKDEFYTHEGARVKSISPECQLRNSVLTTFYEKTFYEDRTEIAERIKTLVPQVDPLTVSKLAVEAREKKGLRHVPLLLLREMARLPQYKRYVARTLSRVITRPDMLCDFVALYWASNGGKKTLSAKVKQGLAFAFQKFTLYDLKKYNQQHRDVTLKDVLFLCHAKPKDEEQAAIWKKLIDNQLTPIIKMKKTKKIPESKL